jgi:hypothetical protein
MTDRVSHRPAAVRWLPVEPHADLGATDRIHIVDPDTPSGSQP